MAARGTALAILVVLPVLAVLSAGAQNPAAPGTDDWKYDVIRLKKGLILQGLVVEQTRDQVVLKCISRKPGRPTIVFTHYLAPNEIDRMVLLDAQERDRLHRRLEAVKNEQQMLAEQLKMLNSGSRPDPPAADAVALKPAPWPVEGKGRALTYQSTYFHLISNSREEVVQLAALLLEQVYHAYARCLPPRNGSAQPTTILVVRSLPEYWQLLQDRGLTFTNGAYYDVGRNQVVCGSDLDRLIDELEKSRATHAKLAAELAERKAELNAVYKGKVPMELLTALLAGQREIKSTEERNGTAFKLARDRFFQRLYHEAFHSYLNNWVYPPGEFEVPLWLNEGLAQIFETAIVEAGTLRVGHADEGRWKDIRESLKTETLLPLTELLRSTPAQFQLAHRSLQQASDRHYLASWGLAFYLTFDRKVLGGKEMDEYVRALKRGADPLDAFQQLVGKPLPAFEKDYLLFLKALRLDGTAPRRE